MMLWVLLWCLLVVPSVTSLRLLPLYSHLSHQYPLLGCWLSYTARGINSVQQTVKSPLPSPPSHSVQEGGSLWVWKRIPRAVSFHSASAGVGILCHVVVVRCSLALHSWSYLHFFCLYISSLLLSKCLLGRTCWSKTPERRCTLIKDASPSTWMLVLELLRVNSRSLLLLHYSLFSVLSISSSVFWTNWTQNIDEWHSIST